MVRGPVEIATRKSLLLLNQRQVRQ